MRAILSRGRLWLVGLTTGGLFVLEGCDPTVREQVLSGVGSAATALATTFIQAFFQALINDAEEHATIVRAVLDQLPQFFA
jgi:hypothetical protein